MVAKKVRWRGAVASKGAAGPLLLTPGDLVLVERGHPRLLVMACPCGCGSDVVVNLDPRSGPAWRMYRTAEGFSLYPSVIRNSGCRSHFVIWNSHFVTVSDDSSLGLSPNTRLEERVREQLSLKGASHYVEIADALGEVPWSVLWALRSLVRQGVVRETEHRDVFELVHRPRMDYDSSHDSSHLNHHG